MKKNLYLGALLVSTILSSSIAVAAISPVEQKEVIKWLKSSKLEQNAIEFVNKFMPGSNFTDIENAVTAVSKLPEDKLELLMDQVYLNAANTMFNNRYTSLDELFEDIENGVIAPTQAQAKKLEGIEKLFGSFLGDSQVEKVAKKYDNHNKVPQQLNDGEDIAQLRNSPEQQESLKSIIHSTQKKVAYLKALGASQEEIKKYIDKQAKVSYDAYFVDPDDATDSSQFTPLQKQDTGATDSLLTSSAQVNLVESVIDNRLINTTGIASGDEPLSYGMWVRGMFSQAKQGSYKLTPGYKFNQHGVTIGFDLGDEDRRIGIAYSFVDSKVNGKNTGIKDKFKTHMGTIYGIHQLLDNVFVDGQVRYGMSKIKKTRNNGNVSGDISSAKPKGTIFGGKLEVGYDYALENKIHLIPTIGVSYDQFEIKGYKEKNGGVDRKVAKRTASKTSALAGFRVSKAIENGSIAIIPEIHANLIYAMQSKNPETTITFFDGMDPMVVPSDKIPKASYKIGGSVKFAKCQKVDLGIGYDLGLSKKFHSHSGYFNARYNF